MKAPPPDRAPQTVTRARPALLLALCCLQLTACGLHLGPGDRSWNQLVGPHRHDISMRVGQDRPTRLHYIDLGRGEPVVLLHGYADSSYSFHRQARPLLAAGFRLILVDLPGLGRSAAPPQPYIYSVENQAGAVLRLLDRLKVRRFHLVGHSMGGAVTLYLSWKHPARVRSAAVLAPASFKPTGLVRLMKIMRVETLARPLFGRWMFKVALLDMFQDHRRVTEAMVDEYAHAAQRPGFVAALFALGREFFSAEFDRMTAAFAELRAPLLIMWGDSDKMLPERNGPKLQQRVPGALYFRIPEAGHNVHQERADWVTPLLVRYLRNQREM